MLATLLFYNLILLSSTFFVFLSEKVRKKAEKLFLLSIAWLLVSLPVGLRYGLGRDYNSYKNIFNNISSEQTASSFEPGFVAINKIVSSLGLGYEAFTIVFSLLIYGIAIIGYPKRGKTLVHFVFVSLLFFQSFNQIRSVLVLSITLLASFSYVENRNIKRYFILIALASTIHISAILLFSLPILEKIINRKGFRLFIPISILTLGLVYFFGSYIIDYIFSSTITKYLGYARYSGGRYDVNPEFGTGIVYLLRLAILLYPIIIYRDILRRNRRFLFLLLSIYFCSLAVILKLNSSIFSRLELLFYLGYLFSIYVISETKKGTIGKVYIGASLAALLIIFNNDLIKGDTSYESICFQSSKILQPYVSIFNKTDATPAMIHGCLQ